MIPLDESSWIISEFCPEADIAIEEHQLWQMSCSCWDGFQTRSCCYFAEATLWSPTALKFFLPSPGEAAILQQCDTAILTFQASAQITTKETTTNLHESMSCYSNSPRGFMKSILVSQLYIRFKLNYYPSGTLARYMYASTSGSGIDAGSMNEKLVLITWISNFHLSIQIVSWHVFTFHGKYLNTEWNMIDFMLVLIPHSMISNCSKKIALYLSQGFSCSENLPPKQLSGTCNIANLEASPRCKMVPGPSTTICEETLCIGMVSKPWSK